MNFYQIARMEILQLHLRGRQMVSKAPTWHLFRKSVDPGQNVYLTVLERCPFFLRYTKMDESQPLEFALL